MKSKIGYKYIESFVSSVEIKTSMIITLPLIICYLKTSLAWISNGLLIFLILRNSPRSMANYKYLMLIFSIFGVIFGIIDISNQPMLHFYQGSYIIFSRNPLGLPRKGSFWFIALNCSCYGMTLSLLSFHFIYRYFAVCRTDLLILFSFPYFNIFIITFIIINLEWWIAAILMASESEFTDEYIRETMLQTYGLTKQDFTYAASVFYSTDNNGSEHLSLWDFGFVLNISVIITLGFSIILFCWLNLRYRLIQSACHHQNYSQKTLDMQRQLFNSLISQTILPIFLMFIPAAILLIFPLFKIEPGHSEGLILSLITTQPFMDALVPMYFVRDYRRAILRFFGKKLGSSVVVLTVERRTGH